MRLATAGMLLVAYALLAPPAQAAPDLDTEKAVALFTAAFKDRCAEHAFDGREKEPDRYEISYRPTMASASDPDSHLVLFSFFCDNFAHSGSAVFIGKDDDGTFSIMSFPYPASRYADDPAAPGKLIVTGINGFGTSDTLLNPEFDAESLTMTTSDHLGNEEYFSTWKFIDGSFHFVSDQTWTFRDGKLERTPEVSEE